LKLYLNVVGKTIAEIENALYEFMKDVGNKSLESNCLCTRNDSLLDYSFSNGTNVFQEDGDEITVHPYD